jgi:putative membrane protein
MADPFQTLEIQRPQVARYFYWSSTLMLGGIGLLTWGVGVIVAVVYALTFGPWLSRKQAEVLEYRLEKSYVFVHQGVFFIKRKTIPLDRITDIILAQGPLLRHFGLWRLDIQTAGSGQQRAEASLYGLTDPERTKELILSARDAAALTNKQNPGF